MSEYERQKDTAAEGQRASVWYNGRLNLIPTVAQGNQPFGGVNLQSGPLCHHLYPVGTLHSCQAQPVRQFAPYGPDPRDGCQPVGLTRGCICPPGANKECQAPMCPRQPLKGAQAL